MPPALCKLGMVETPLVFCGGGQLPAHAPGSLAQAKAQVHWAIGHGRAVWSERVWPSHLAALCGCPWRRDPGLAGPQPPREAGCGVTMLASFF